MQSIEFETQVKDGIIHIPQGYSQKMQGKIKVTVLYEEKKDFLSQREILDELKAYRVSTKNFQFNREEANER